MQGQSRKQADCKPRSDFRPFGAPRCPGKLQEAHGGCRRPWTLWDGQGADLNDVKYGIAVDACAKAVPARVEQAAALLTDMRDAGLTPESLEGVTAIDDAQWESLVRPDRLYQ